MNADNNNYISAKSIKPINKINSSDVYFVENAMLIIYYFI